MNMQIERLRIPLSEQLRPQCLSDLMLTNHQVLKLQRMVETKNLSNMIFFGPPGVGKTSAARILAKELNADVFNVDGSNERGGSIILKEVPRYVGNVSMFGNPKLVLIDEGEFMTRKDQVSLRSTIEDSYDNCRFIITTNDLKRIDRAIQSRLLSIAFDVQLTRVGEVIERLTERISNKLYDLSIEHSKIDLAKIIRMYFPDFRQTMNQIEYEFA